MKRSGRIGIVVALALAAVAAVGLNKKREQPGAPVRPASATKPLPKLIDLGAGKCIPCKAMAPILEQLRSDFAGQFTVEFIDVWKSPEAGKNYKIQMIPTQIFYDAAGRELYRHEGFIGREDILGIWREKGFDFAGRAALAREQPRKGEATNAARQFVAYYFHGTTRCETCLSIEEQAKAATAQEFPAQLAANELAFHSVDYDLPANKHFLREFELASPSLVLVERKAGRNERWKLLGRTWELAHQPEKFKSYVVEELNHFLTKQQQQGAGERNKR